MSQPLFFIPSAVGVIEYGDIMSKFGVSILLVVVISTFVVMVSTGTLTQLIAKERRKNKRVHRNHKFILNCLSIFGREKLYIRFPRVYTSPLLITPAVLVVLFASCQCPVSDIQSRRRTADRYASAGNSGVRHPAL